MANGKFIVIEGVDGSGKSTQNNLLAERLAKEGYKVERIDFPQYGTKSAGLVEEYLTGKYGSSEKVGPYRASVFYACDRYDASFKINKWLNDGKIVVSDRYVASNIGHQGGKINDRKEREDYFKWLYNLEYNIFEIPRPNFTFILKTSAEFSLKLANKITDKEKISKRKAYLGDSEIRDIHEKDREHLSNALKSYLHIAELYPEEFKIIECIKNDQLLPKDVIHQEIWNNITKIL
jgi:dTMP kinase